MTNRTEDHAMSLHLEQNFPGPQKLAYRFCSQPLSSSLRCKSAALSVCQLRTLKCVSIFDGSDSVDVCKNQRPVVLKTAERQAG